MMLRCHSAGLSSSVLFLLLSPCVLSYKNSRHFKQCRLTMIESVRCHDNNNCLWYCFETCWSCEDETRPNDGRHNLEESARWLLRRFSSHYTFAYRNLHNNLNNRWRWWWWWWWKYLRFDWVQKIVMSRADPVPRRQCLIASLTLFLLSPCHHLARFWQSTGTQDAAALE